MSRPTRYGRHTVSGPRGTLGTDDDGARVWIQTGVDGTETTEPADAEDVIATMSAQLESWRVKVDRHDAIAWAVEAMLAARSEQP